MISRTFYYDSNKQPCVSDDTVSLQVMKITQKNKFFASTQSFDFEEIIYQ